MAAMKFARRLTVAIAALAIGAHSAASAQSVAAVASQILADPTHLPLPGQFDGETDYDHRSLDYDSFKVSGVPVNRNRTDANIVLQTVSYGVVPRLAVSVEGVYVDNDTSETTVGHAKRHTSVEGFEDPTFGALYRPILQGRSPVTLDLSLAYSPNILSSATGTPVAGGDELTLEASVARAERFETIQFYTLARHYGRAVSTDATDFRSVDSSYWRPTVGLVTQTRFDARLSLNVGANYSFDRDSSVLEEHSNRDGSFSGGAVEDVGAALNYRIIPFRLVASLAYEHEFFDRSFERFQTAPASDLSTERSEDEVGVRLRYVIH